MKDLSGLRLYTRVARLGSFSAAARESGLSQPQVSRIIADLEADLGVRLLTRSTRSVAPTEPGEAFLVRLEPLLAELQDAEDQIRDGHELRGRVRIATPTSFGVREVIPRLADFIEAHPRVHVHLQLDDRRQDLVRDAIDVALRLGRPPDTTGTTRTLAAIPRVVVAAPAYLKRAGTPASPDELRRHRIVGGTASAVPEAWRFSRRGEEALPRLEPHFSTDDNEGAIAAVVAGLGITSTSGWACRRELERGELVRLFEDWRLPAIAVHAYFPMGHATRAAARALVDHLAATLGQNGAVEAAD